MSRLFAKCRVFLWQLNLHWVRKLMIAVAGGSVVLIGVAMLVLPGPAILVIPLGLVILATEFVWAKRWLKNARALLPKPAPGPAAQPKLNQPPSAGQPWYSPGKLWQRKSTAIAALAIAGIISYLVLRYGVHSPSDTCRIPAQGDIRPVT